MAWRDALPMLRVHHEVTNQAYGPYRTGNLFAGSVMFLQPGTKYEKMDAIPRSRFGLCFARPEGCGCG